MRTTILNVTVSLALVAASSGCNAEAPTSPLPEEALRARFPPHAAHVLDEGAPLEPTPAGFVRSLPAPAAGFHPAGGSLDAVLPATQLKNLDRFDRVQLEDVLAVCRQSATLSDAGRVLFAASRRSKKTPNDADRLRKYLARFDLTWQDIKVEL